MFPTFYKEIALAILFYITLIYVGVAVDEYGISRHCDAYVGAKINHEHYICFRTNGKGEAMFKAFIDFVDKKDKLDGKK